MARHTCALPPSADEYATVKPRETRRPHVHPELNDKLQADHSPQASDIYVNINTNSLLMKPRKTEEVVVVHLPKTEGWMQRKKGAEVVSQIKTSGRLEPSDTRFPEPDERLYACVSKPASPASRLPVRTLKMDIEKKLRLFATDEEFSNFSSGLLYDCKIGSRKENDNKNRFNNIIPYDSTRVVLEKVLGNEASDYINASFIRGYKKDKAYIAAQGPKDNTSGDFWRMVWQENVIQIIMLTNLVEIGKSTCFEYWPSKGESHGYGPIEVKCLHEEHRAHFIVRSFHLRPRNVTKFRQVDQLQFTSWMDHEIPSDAGLIDFWKFAKSHPSACSASPRVVHCSAGIGRTGTYIALDIVMEQAKQEGNIDILGVVTRLREDRCSMVQNKEQYSFLHQVVLEAYSGLNSQLSLATRHSRILSERHRQKQRLI